MTHRIRPAKYLTILLLLAAITFAPLRAWALVPGVVVIDPLNLPLVEQNAALAELKAEGIHLIRVNLEPTSASVDFAKRAFDHGIRIDALVVTVSAKDAVRRPNPVAFPGMSECFALSAAADPGLSLASFESLLQQLDAAGVTLAGLELDNEINWAQSNADFALPGEGKILSLKDLRDDAEGRQIARGFARYVEILQLLKQARDHSARNRTTPIILAGLYETPAEGPRGPSAPRIDAVSIDATIEFMRTQGLDRIVDAYGIHVYPTQPTPLARKMNLEKMALAQCRRQGASSGKPCWITEWGVANHDTACPLDDSARAAVVGEMMDEFRSLSRSGELLAVIYYSWNAKPGANNSVPLSVTRCGHLTNAGKLAVQP